MDLPGLQTHLTADRRHNGRLEKSPRDSALNCTDQLLAIGLEYSMRKAEADGKEIQIGKVEQELQWIVTAFEEAPRRIMKMTNELRGLLVKMSADMDVALGHDSYKEASGDDIEDWPEFSPEFRKAWVQSRAPEWLGIASKAMAVSDDQSPMAVESDQASKVAMMVAFSACMGLALEDLKALKLARAKQGVKTISPPLDHTGWLVHSVATSVVGSGGKRSHVLPIAQVIAEWADPSCELGDQWGKSALARVK